MLSQNPIILLSLINTKLRDFYDSLSDLCEDLGESEEDILSLLGEAGYFYNVEKNQFVLK